MTPRLARAPLPAILRVAGLLVISAAAPSPLHATPANKSALEKHYDRFLTKDLNRCITCHLPSDRKSPETLTEFPHNPFGDRLRAAREQLLNSGAKATLPERLKLVAHEDSDGDGADNQSEILLGRNPGDAKDSPSTEQLASLAARQQDFAKFQATYRWEPFERVRRPEIPAVKNRRWARNPIDAFIAAEHETRQLTPRPQAPREILLRRVYIDLIGLSPTPDEQRAFLADRSPDAYEKVVERLLNDPRHGERWGRHWMDVWRYSDWAGWTDGGQVRDSKPHIWRWRDWIVESLNRDKPYDRMITEMLAADELAPEDTDALRATGFLVRNYKLLSREQWLEDTVKHTSQAFLGVTVGCAKCHNHMTDPISQKEYYQVRAIFEPHQVRTDKVPGQTNTVLDGLARAFDVGTNPPTWFFHRGDERHPDTNHIIAPGVPAAFGGRLKISEVALPRSASAPDQRDFVIRDTIAASEKALADARANLLKLQTNSTSKPEQRIEQESVVRAGEARHKSLLAVIRAEQADLSTGKDSQAWKLAATEAKQAQRQLALTEVQLKLHSAKSAELLAKAKADEATTKTNGVEKATKELDAARKKTTDTEQALASANTELQAAPATDFTPRPQETFPASSTGRRLAFAHWVANADNPLTARVAMNHMWLRHFGRGIVPTTADFGRNGRPPSHPQLLDWLASEFAAHGWSMKAMHRLMVTSSTYRQASTPDDASASTDPDNVYLWRMNSRRIEAEAVRDNLLYVSGDLDTAMGGPDIDHKHGLTSKRRSIYLRLAAEKEVEFLKIFDGPSVTECYERKPSVVPQQALALANSELALARAKALAKSLSARASGDDEQFISLAYRQVLARRPTLDESRLCLKFLGTKSADKPEATPVLNKPVNAAQSTSALRSRENLILVLLNHNEFVTVR